MFSTSLLYSNTYTFTFYVYICLFKKSFEDHFEQNGTLILAFIARNVSYVFKYVINMYNAVKGA